MIVGVDDLVFAPGAAEDFQGPVGDDLVGVHVGGGARPALDHVHHELAVQIAGDDFIAGLADGLRHLFFQVAQLLIGLGGRLLDHRQGLDEVGEVRQRDAGDIIVLQGSQGLDPKVGIGRHLPLTEQIVFQALFTPGRSRYRRPPVSEARILQAVGHDPGDLGQDLARHFRVLFQDVCDRLALQRQDAGVHHGPAGIGMLVFIQHGAFAHKVALTDAGHRSLNIPDASQDFDFSGLDDEHLRARCAGVKEVSSQRVGSAGDLVYQKIQFGF